MANQGLARRHVLAAIGPWLLFLAVSLCLCALRVPAYAQSGSTAASDLSVQPENREAEARSAAAPEQDAASPPPKVSVTSGFGKRRDPINRRKRFHTGVDISRPAGTEVFSWQEGVVAHKGWKGKYGLTVDILHENGLVSRYAHLKQAAVVSGQPVAAGQLVGLIGRTGRTTGPNLHFEILVDGKRSDPRKQSVDFSQIVGESARKTRHIPTPEDILRQEMPFTAGPEDAFEGTLEAGDLLNAPTM